MMMTKNDDYEKLCPEAMDFVNNLVKR